MAEAESEAVSVSAVKKKRSFTASFKLKVVEYAEKNSNRGAARKFSVDDKRVREWRKQKNSLTELPTKKRRLEGGGRKAAYPNLEEVLVSWIEQLREENLRVTRSSVQAKALELVPQEEEFVASRGWLEKFFRRNGFSLRRRTTVSQRLPEDLQPKVISFIMKTRQLRLKNQYPLSMIGNMDETPLWLDMPGETTITHTGDRSVPVRTTGHDKARFTVVLSAMADGRKLKPYVVFKGVRSIPELLKENGVIVALSKNGWMNEDLTKDWVKRGWGNISFGRRLLVWDAYKCHLMDSVYAVATQSDISVIPGGLTSLVQPADLSWNKPFKEAYKALYNDWLLNGEKSYTTAGNVRAPSKLTCLKWVKKAWDSVTHDVIKRSFEACGISVATDGSEDDKIHCLKDGQVAAPACSAIAEKTAALFKPYDVDNEDESDDPFADIEDHSDEEELMNNEIAIDDC